MLGFLRFLIIGFVVMTLFYGLLSIYVRSLTRERLEEDWEKEGSIGERDAYVEEGIKAYERSFRPKLLLLVYILPLIVFAAIFYVTNFL
ncbi:MAG: hypothetical protein HWE33_13440 [Rhodobacteraceae bacterium]|uniref:hypothetical protein n=1 Tax=Celeribacter sp. HF31 TaxID=2721558 RepID=UPI00142F9E38|nr:hypothetical protein [Celeribacter sp. HF31]NIY79773.1 hypothetical protein [Celeribacter sp. HF31]NVK47302.1 hypothetical protein [Paracoccaceae bacterium]